MNEPDFSRCRVAILGLGLMGGSLAMALREKCAMLIGLDADPQIVEQARQMGLVDQASTQASGLLSQADLVLFATPVGAILELLARLPEWHSGQAVVLDVGSTKSQIVQAMSRLPARFDPLGGHPMCGKERGSLANAERGLFLNAPFALVPLPRTSPYARSLTEQLVRAVGARPVGGDGATHDRWVAATSHAPYLIANALAASISAEVQPMIGPGLRGASRLAATPLNMILDVLKTNPANTVAALHRFQSQLNELAGSLETGDLTRLGELLEQGLQQYNTVIRPPDSRI